MAGEDVEVGADLLNVHRHVRHSLSSVDQDECACGVCHLGHLAHGVDRAEHVRNVGEGDELGPEVEEHLEHFELQNAVIGDRNEFEVAVLLLDEDLPRNQVGVVLHLGQYDRVAAADVASTPGVGDEVDRFGGIPDEHDLVRVGGVDQARRHGPGVLVGRGRSFRQLVYAAVDVGGVFGVVGVHCLDHGQRFLAGRGAVEVDERLAEPVHRLEDREIGTNASGVQGPDRGTGGPRGSHMCGAELRRRSRRGGEVGHLCPP